jgi:hypothetical protein
VLTEGSLGTRRLANAVNFLVGRTNGLQAITTAIPVGGAIWTEQILNNMRRRVLNVRTALAQNVADRSQGQRIGQTVDALRQVFEAIDDLRAHHGAEMSQSQGGDLRQFVGLLAEILSYLSNDTDLYAGRGQQPVFVGEGFSSERRLLRSFLGGKPIEFFEVLRRFDRESLHPHAGTLRGVCDILARNAHETTNPQDKRDKQRAIAALLQVLHREFWTSYRYGLARL